MAELDVRVEHIGHVDVVTIDRPEVRNALRFQSYDELERAVRDSTARCILITGADPVFCSGDDVREVMGGGNGPKPTAVAPRLTPAADALLHTDIPVIAAVNGAAVGVGSTMQLPMDIRIASDSARFGFVFARRGIVPEAASSYFLPRVVGISQALEWCYSGRVFDAQEALKIVDYVYFIADGVIVAHGDNASVQASNDPFVHQFIRGRPDGPVPFHYSTSGTGAYAADLDMTA